MLDFRNIMMAIVLLMFSAILVSSEVIAQDASQPGPAAASPEPATPSLTNQVPSAMGTPTGAQLGGIEGTATDTNDNVISGATAVLQGPSPADRQVRQANEAGFFSFSGVKPGVAYRLTVSLKGFTDWNSPPIVIGPGQFTIVPGIKMRGKVETVVNVPSSPDEIAMEEVHIAEKQRVLGVVPNFYVVYDSQTTPPQPLTPKAKFQLAMRLAADPVTIAGVSLFSAIEQAADTPNYRQGWNGYGQRFGANAADGFTSNLIGGAVLPSLLHQDPRYFYRGTGSTRSRLLYAAAHPFICKSDSGKWQMNISSLGGDLSQSAISNLYYPSSNRGTGLVFQNFAISTAERMLTGVLQEFVLPKFTHRAKP